MWHVSLNMSYQVMEHIHLEIESSYRINICSKTGILELLGIILLTVNHARSVSNEIQNASYGLKWTIYSSVFWQFRLLMMKLSFSWRRLVPLFCPTTFIWKLQHKAYFLIQLNADSRYPFACWSPCLLCLLILMLVILMLILIESRSMLIVHWLGDRKLINAYLTKNSMQNINLPKDFLKI